MGIDDLFAAPEEGSPFGVGIAGKVDADDCLMSQDGFSDSSALTANFKRLKDLEARLGVLEILNRAYWTLFMERGLTHEDLNKAIAAALENKKNQTNRKQYRVCEQCGRRMQAASVFETKCIYCGHNTVGNPYEFVTDEEEHEELEEKSIQKHEVFTGDRPVDNDAYDLDDDLKFDDLE